MNNLFLESQGVLYLCNELETRGCEVAIPSPDIGDDIWYCSPQSEPGAFHRIQVKAITAVIISKKKHAARLFIQKKKIRSSDVDYIYAVLVRFPTGDWQAHYVSAEDMHDVAKEHGKYSDNSKVLQLEIHQEPFGKMRMTCMGADVPIPHGVNLPKSVARRRVTSKRSSADCFQYATNCALEFSAKRYITAIPRRSGPPQVWLLSHNHCRKSIIEFSRLRHRPAKNRLWNLIRRKKRGKIVEEMGWVYFDCRHRLFPYTRSMIARSHAKWFFTDGNSAYSREELIAFWERHGEQPLREHRPVRPGERQQYYLSPMIDRNSDVIYGESFDELIESIEKIPRGR